MSLTMIKAIIFDMDGVLIDAKDWHYEALNRALSLFGLEISRYDHLTTYDGLPTKRKLEILSLERELPMELHSFINQMKQLYTMEIVHSRCKPRFIHEYALSTLKSRGYKLAVASNSIQDSVEIMMKKAKLDIYLDTILSTGDVILPKPNPEIYIKAIARLNLSPSECLVVEDNKIGVRAAMDSGAHILVVRHTDDVNLENISARIQEVENL
ncbi:HAD family phosphatase [Pseudomonas viridiflava]|nr:HAD family phosphatase [Pseudomonas viridiflava]